MEKLLEFISSLDPEETEERRQLLLLSFIVFNTMDGKELFKQEAAADYKEYAGIAEISADDPYFFMKCPEYIALRKKDIICLSLDYKRGKTLLKFRNTYDTIYEEDNLRKITSLLSSKLGKQEKKTSSRKALQEAKRIQRMRRKIEREFVKKKYISDIKISDYEYDYLKKYLANVLKKGIIPDDAPLFAVAVVQAACKSYSEGNFWRSLFDEIGVKDSQALRKKIGEVFYDTLVRHGKAVSGKGETKENVLLHSFVSDSALDAYFTFLYKFYVLDLERDITQLDKEQLNVLVDSICYESTKVRSYMLLQHTRQAVAANKGGAKIRIRNQLKRMDRLFWDREELRKSNHRIYAAMDEWAEKNEDFHVDRERIRERGRTRGERRFSSPYYRFIRLTGTFLLVLPEQRITFGYGTGIYWEIPEMKQFLSVQLRELVSCYKSVREEVEVPSEKLLHGYTAYLKNRKGDVIRTFKVPGTTYLFFDSDGDEVSAKSLKPGDFSAITAKDESIESSGLTDSIPYKGMRLSHFSLEYEDMIRLPDGNAVLIGRKNIDNSLLERGRLEEAVSEIDGNRCPLYSEIPYITVRTTKDRLNGTAISIDGKLFKLSDLTRTEFIMDDGSNDVGCYIALSEMGDLKDGHHRIVVDIPPNTFREWDFCLIKGLDFQFEDAPYLFEPRGTIRIGGAEIREDEKGLNRVSGTDVYEFEIEEVGRFLKFAVRSSEGELSVEIPVPALFTKDQKGDWTSSRPGTLWYTDVPDVVEVSAPGRSISLFVDGYSEEENETREIEFSKRRGDDYFACDIVRLKSYLNDSDMILCPIGIKCGQIEEELFSVMTRNVIVSKNIMGDFSSGSVTVNIDYLGKDDCCIDMFMAGKKIADKVDVVDHKAAVPSQQGGKYRVLIYEKKEDDDGFGTDYELIDEFEQKVIDPNDLSGRSIRILNIREESEIISGKYTELRLLYQNYVINLSRTEEKGLYKGKLIVDQREGEHIAAVDVFVRFDNTKDPEYIKLFFLDDSGYKQDFLYDVKRKGILQMENPDLGKREKYRRYSVLWEDNHSFRIDFCEKEEVNCRSLPSRIRYPEAKDDLAVMINWNDPHRNDYRWVRNSLAEHPKKGIEDTLIEKAGFTTRTYNCLKRAGMKTYGDVKRFYISKGAEGFSYVRGCKKKSIEEILNFLSKNGLI